MIVTQVFHSIICDECPAFVLRLLKVEDFRGHVPETPNEISEDNSNDDESEYPVHVHHHVLSDDPLVPRTALKERLQELVEPADVHQLYQTRQSEQPE